MTVSRSSSFPRSVVWTRGDGCEALARILTTETAVRAESDLPSACVTAKAELVVMSSPGSFDIVATATPVNVDLEKVTHVVAAVGGGPHSYLAAQITRRLADGLGVPGELLSGYRGEEGKAEAASTVEEAAQASGLPGRTVLVKGASDLVEGLRAGGMLVLGAPGGSWLQRQFFGPGARLTSGASGGAVVVRDAPMRAFHLVEPLNGLGRQMRAGDARLVATSAVHPVLDDGKLVGVVRIAELERIDPDVTVGDVMESAPHASVYDTLDELSGMDEFYEGAAVPVVDRDGTMRGGVVIPH